MNKKFRGMDSSGRWHYGCLMLPNNIFNYFFIVDNNDNSHMILGDTVGQFTGFKDSKGIEIYEGDTLTDSDGGTRQVYFCEIKGAWMLDYSFDQDKSYGDLLSENLSDFEMSINGNIHKNK